MKRSLFFFSLPILVMALTTAAETPSVQEEGPSMASSAADPGRPEIDRKRDAARKPMEVLAFLGIEPGMRVGEAFAARGYYTEILARGLGPDGRLYAHNSPKTDGFFGEDLRARVARVGMDTVELVVGEPEEPGLPDGLDAVLLFRFYHDFCWFGSDRGAFNRAVFRALKPGGIYGVLDHHAKHGTGCSEGQRLHRIDAELVRKEILAAGFVLEDESDLLTNPDDTRDWNIFDDDAKKRDRTDRFLWRFRKPAS